SAGRHEREPGYARCGGGFRVACAAGTGGASGWAGCAEWTDSVELSGWLGVEWADWEDGAAEWRVVSGPGEIRGGLLGFSGMGEVVVAGTLPGRGGVADCSVARTVMVGKASAKVSFEGAAVQEAGRVEEWGVRTEPEGLAVEVRYDGGEAVPQEAGWHAVEAEVADERYKGRATGALVAVEPGRYLVVDLSGGTEAESWPWKVLEGIPEGGWTEEDKTDKLVLRWVEPGPFTRGSPEDESGRGGDEQAHAVTLTKGFWMGVFEVTQRQMELAVGKTNFACKIGSLPASGVSYEAVRGASSGAGWPADGAVDEGSFFGVLRAKTGLAFDLPTEAEWEYACRAGTETALNSGKDLDGTSWRETNAAEVGRYRYNSGFSGAGDGRGLEKGVARAGSYLPNAWGLHDMHGNLREWCLDWYGAYGEGAAVDPAGASNGTARTFRGGSFCDGAVDVRSARRARMSPRGWSWEMGFRAACHGEVREESAP
ncbi:MAG: formylglycine-generating enzyme family protein, partial [Kiritimatiellae bacterium]|nr:formylglycine-generating enzyme family protein [Kiritimatiellia bacterium]